MNYQNKTRHCNGINSVENKYHPLINEHIRRLLINNQFGLMYLNENDIMPIPVSFCEYNDENNEDVNLEYISCFEFKIPYAGKRLTWKLIFNPEDFTMAPEIIFDNDSFYIEDVDKINKYSNLKSWDVKNVNCLSIILREYVQLFKDYQVKQLGKDNIYENFRNDYNILCLDKNISTKTDLELLVESNSIHLLININVDCSSLPIYLQLNENEKTNPMNDRAILKIHLNLDRANTIATLNLSPRLEHILGRAKDLSIPQFTKNVPLAEYVGLVSQLLKTCLSDIEKSFTLRQKLILCLACEKNYNVIEYDCEKYYNIVLLCEVDDYRCLVHVDLENFPKERPMCTLQSIFCHGFKKLCLVEFNNYHYNPRWQPKVVVDKVMSSIVNAILNFRDHHDN